MSRAWVAVVAAFLLAGCRPPESERTRGDGPGADVGNRGGDLRIHERRAPDRDVPAVTPRPTAPERAP